MATERQRRANRQNAQRSTGPKTRAGKTRITQNARSHGLTTPPPVDEVLNYYRIIIEDAKADPSKAVTEAEWAALALAECEASCDRALRAETKALDDMAIYLKTKGERDVRKLLETCKELDLENPAILEMMMRSERDETEKDEITSGALRILHKINRHNLALRRRRLDRIAVYRQRAEGRRRRAFKAWMRARSENAKSKPNAIIG